MAEKEQPGKGLSIASMVCGIVSVVFSWFVWISLPTGVCAIVFYAIQRRKGIKDGMATTGLVTGIVGLAIALIVLITVGAAISALEGMVISVLD